MDSMECKPSKAAELKAAFNFSKIPPDVRKRRRNFRFKKLMAPKNPLMILNELKPKLSFQFSETICDNNQIVFTATVEVEGKIFSGQGMSKKLAQQAAAEEALKGLYFHKLVEQLPVKKESDEHDVEMDSASEDCSSSISDPKAHCQQNLESTIPEDDTPWSSLASLAFYKLIHEWQTPASVVSSTTSSPDSAKPPSGLRKLPENATSLDPVMLLHQISPNSKFIETARDFRDGDHFFTLAVEFNGLHFEGTATKKKDAKKICAKKALATISVNYPE